MKWISIDPGSKHLGWAVFKDKQLYKYGVIEPPDDLSLGQKLLYIGFHITKLILKYKIKYGVVEYTYTVHRNSVPISATLFEVTSIFSKYGLNLTRYNNTSIKAKYKIRVQAKKGQKVSQYEMKERMREAVLKEYSVQELSQDKVDAILIGMFHISKL